MRVPSFRRALLVAVLTAALAPAAASAAPRMWVGFQDDASFRWENRERSFDLANQANATVIRTTVYWSKVAPTRPQNAANPFDPAYQFADLDDAVRAAQKRGIEVLLTIWGTPRWAGPAQNRLPRRLADFQNFSRAVAARYSGRYAGYPYVRFFSIWNEPNRGKFLSPQFNSRGRSVAALNYAKLVRAGWAGIKGANPTAEVAIGETASNGRDRKVTGRGLQDTHSPGRFAQLLAAVRPRIKFDAWAHHPYPTSPSMKPTQRMRWPNVSLASLPPFEQAVDRWFGRRSIPIWITEYGHETRPDRHGISTALQRTYLSQAFAIARRDARVQMFVWFILADRSTVPWESGLVAAGGALKPAYSTFRSLARGVDARNAIVKLSARNPVVRVSALPIRYYSPTGAPIGVTWTVWRIRTALLSQQPVVGLQQDGWITLRLPFRPAVGVSYRLTVTATDANGNGVQRTLTLIGSR